MLGERVAPPSEATKAIVLEDSPWMQPEDLRSVCREEAVEPQGKGGEGVVEPQGKGGEGVVEPHQAGVEAQ